MSCNKEHKIFNDPVHGSIELHPLCVKIIDTPQFQRMRNIKQLGFCYFVYPGASHNRFEHSIGTCHLASLMVKNLQQRQPGLNITDKDRLCVEISGLCHDLGHGPFSHTFDQTFLPRISPENTWVHEKGSIDMFDYLYKENEKVQEQFREAGLTEEDKIFIKNLIKPNENFKNTGRGKDKGFLYEIISNKENGIDVDKWDYFARDCHHLGIKNNVDHQRLMKCARVIDGHISYRDKTAENIYNMFYHRRNLHKSAYQHKIVNIISEMFVQALLHANDHITRIGSDGKMWSISKSIGDMKAYSQFTDNIFEEILYSTSEDLKYSREILEKIIRRNLHIFIGEVPLPLTFKRKIEEIKEIEGIKKIKQDIYVNDKELVDQLIICKTNLNYGSKSGNPVDKVKFHSKYGETKILSQDMISHMLPKTFAETYVQVFVQDCSYFEKATEAFKKWQESLKKI